jgi:hypothetical protein
MRLVSELSIEPVAVSISAEWRMHESHAFVGVSVSANKKGRWVLYELADLEDLMTLG